MLISLQSFEMLQKSKNFFNCVAPPFSLVSKREFRTSWWCKNGRWRPINLLIVTPPTVAPLPGHWDCNFDTSWSNAAASFSVIIKGKKSLTKNWQIEIKRQVLDKRREEVVKSRTSVVEKVTDCSWINSMPAGTAIIILLEVVKYQIL